MDPDLPSISGNFLKNHDSDSQQLLSSKTAVWDVLKSGNVKNFLYFVEIYNL